jgi:hypothetical protein
METQKTITYKDSKLALRRLEEVKKEVIKLDVKYLLGKIYRSEYLYKRNLLRNKFKSFKRIICK